MLKKLVVYSVVMLAIAACETTAEDTGTAAGAGAGERAVPAAWAPRAFPRPVIRPHP